MSIVYDGSIMVRFEDAISPKNRRKLPDVSLTAPAPMYLGAADVSLTALTPYGLKETKKKKNTVIESNRLAERRMVRETD